MLLTGGLRHDSNTDSGEQTQQNHQPITCTLNSNNSDCQAHGSLEATRVQRWLFNDDLKIDALLRTELLSGDRGFLSVETYPSNPDGKSEA